MGVVFKATQLALGRPVALKAIAPELAADVDYRERFQRESQLAASIDHANVIPVYEAGELDGTLYLIMRWVEGTDLRTLLARAGRVSPARAIRLLRPVASALAAAHRRGLVHRDVKPANVMIARGDDENDDHTYLTDFGIARQADGDSLTRTGIFVGTVDYSAPERIQGGKGDASSDIYSLGCVLFETLTGHAPYERPADVSKIYAHVYDPIPSARAEVDGVPERLDAIVARAMAKRPEDRFRSAGELTAALDQALQDLETGERTASVPQSGPEITNRPVPAAETKPAAAATQPAAAASQAAAVEIQMSAPPTAPAAPPSAPAAPVTALSAQPTAPAAPVTAPTEPGPVTAPTEPGPVTAPTEPGPVTARADPPAAGPPTQPSRRRAPMLLVAAIVLVAAAGALVASLSGGGNDQSKAGATSTALSAAPITVQGSGLTKARTIDLGSPPGSVSVGRDNVWISLPERGALVRVNLGTGLQRSFPAAGSPTPIAAGSKALWVGEIATQSLSQFNGTSGAQVAVTPLPGTATALALDQGDSSAWVADSSGVITHVGLGGSVVRTPAHADRVATSIAWGEGWLWAADGADNGLVRVSRGVSGATTAFSVGPGPVAVALDQGVWTAHADGHVTRFDPRATHLRVNADLKVAPDLAGIAAMDPSPFAWAISKSTRTLYRVTNTGTPAVTGTVVFGSAPVALAVNANSVWVATEDGRVTEIRF